VALDLLDIAEFGWHDRFDEVGLPKEAVRKQLGDMIALITAKLGDY
jgi:hypothetical protein